MLGGISHKRRAFLVSLPASELLFHIRARAKDIATKGIEAVRFPSITSFHRSFSCLNPAYFLPLVLPNPYAPLTEPGLEVDHYRQWLVNETEHCVDGMKLFVGKEKWRMNNKAARKSHAGHRVIHVNAARTELFSQRIYKPPRTHGLLL
jgi:hypothetical protein